LCFLLFFSLLDLQAYRPRSTLTTAEDYLYTHLPAVHFLVLIHPPRHLHLQSLNPLPDCDSSSLLLKNHLQLHTLLFNLHNQHYSITMMSQKGYRSPSSEGDSRGNSVIRIPTGRRGTSSSSVLSSSAQATQQLTHHATEQSESTHKSSSHRNQPKPEIHNNGGKTEDVARTKYWDGKKWR